MSVCLSFIWVWFLLLLYNLDAQSEHEGPAPEAVFAGISGDAVVGDATEGVVVEQVGTPQEDDGAAPVVFEGAVEEYVVASVVVVVVEIVLHGG